MAVFPDFILDRIAQNVRTAERAKKRRLSLCSLSQQFLYFTFFLEFFMHFLVLIDIVGNLSESEVRIFFMILVYILYIIAHFSWKHIYYYYDENEIYLYSFTGLKRKISYGEVSSFKKMQGRNSHSYIFFTETKSFSIDSELMHCEDLFNYIKEQYATLHDSKELPEMSENLLLHYIRSKRKTSSANRVGGGD